MEDEDEPRYEISMMESLAHTDLIVTNWDNQGEADRVYGNGVIIGKEIDAHLTVDVVCYSIGLCYVDPGRRMCNLFPLPPNFELPSKNTVHRILNEELIVKKYPWICYLPGIYRLCEALSDTYTKLLPAVDIDGDK